MKTLEELGISPAPWECARNDCGEFVGVTNKHGFYAVRFAYDIPPNDARLIAAAPELYDAAERYIRFHEESCIHGNRSAGEILADCRKAYQDLKAALAKAGGEEVCK